MVASALLASNLKMSPATSFRLNSFKKRQNIKLETFILTDNSMIRLVSMAKSAVLDQLIWDCTFAICF